MSTTIVIPREQKLLLEEFVDLMNTKPEMYKLPEIQFYKEWVENKGGRIPDTDREPPCYDITDSEDEESDPESDLDLEGLDDVIQDTDDTLPEYGDEAQTVVDGMKELADKKKSEGIIAKAEGRSKDAIACFTEAIIMNPSSSLLYVKRASVYFSMQKPKKAICDCDKAVKLDTESVQGYKWRGKAYKLLGKWEEAHSDFKRAYEIGEDDDVAQLLNDVTPNVEKIIKHRLKYKKIREEKEKKKKQRKKKSLDDVVAHTSSDFQEGLPNFNQMFQGADLLQAMKSPGLLNALSDQKKNNNKPENLPAKKHSDGAKSFPVEPDID